MFSIKQPVYVCDCKSVSVTTTPQNIDLGAAASYLHNTGAGKVFIAPGNQVSNNTKWELASGEKIYFPITGVINVVSDSSATLKILVVDPYLN